jgi:hypothetical protein
MSIASREPAAGLADEEIRHWAHSRSVAWNIAAELAASIRSGTLARWDELPETAGLARK